MYDRRPSAGNVLYRTASQRNHEGSSSATVSSSGALDSANSSSSSFEDMLRDLENTRTSLPASLVRGRSSPGTTTGAGPPKRSIESIYQSKENEKSRERRAAAASSSITSSPNATPSVTSSATAATAATTMGSPSMSRDLARSGAAAGSGSTSSSLSGLAKASDTMDALLRDLDSALLSGSLHGNGAADPELNRAAPTASAAAFSPNPERLKLDPPRKTISSLGPRASSGNVASLSSSASSLVGSGPTTPTNVTSPPMKAASPSLVNEAGMTLGQQIKKKEQERREAERLAKEKAEKERLEKERLERERLEAEERERIAEERRKEDQKERERKEKGRREAERKELERIDAERRAAEIERLGFEGLPPGPEDGIDERIVTPDYVNGLSRTLRSDQTLSPIPEDFSSPDGFTLWQRQMGISLQEVLCDLLKVRFIDPPPARPKPPRPEGTVDIFFKIIEARGLQAKEGKTRDAYCKIEIGNMPDLNGNGAAGGPGGPGMMMGGGGGGGSNGGAAGGPAARLGDRAGPDTEVYMTEVVKQSLSPIWNQHLEVQARRPTDWIVVSVWDIRKDYFLGMMKVRIDDLLSKCSTDGFLGKWYRLEPRAGKHKDKYVGGEILIEVNINVQQPITDIPLSPIGTIQSHLLSCKINFKSLYRTLLRSCLDLDMALMGKYSESTAELLSPESRTCLRIWAKMWLVGDAFQVIANLELLFKRYMNCRVPVRALLNAYEAVYANMKASPDWLTEYDKPALVELLEEMQVYYRQQVSHYQEHYPKNKPEEALESTVLMLRMIHKNPIYRELHPDLPTSFRAEIESVMNEASHGRFQKLQQLAAPLDESDVEAVVESLVKLTELLTEDVVNDAKYFREPFENEVDIVRLTAENYLSNLVKAMDSHQELFGSDEVVRFAGKGMFTLYKKLRVLDEKLNKVVLVKDRRQGGKMVPGIKRVAAYADFSIERWFLAYVSNWLSNLSNQTLEWVTNAVKVDNFDVVVGDRNDEANPPHSSSVTDLFTAVYQELGFIADLNWKNEIQSAGFFQKFAKMVNKAVEQYCDAIGTGELKPNEPSNTGNTWTSLLQTATQGKQQPTAPKDITSESCVKLCNIEFALMKLDDMYRLMNVATLTRAMKDYRATLAPPPQSTSTSPTASQSLDDNTLKGAFKMQLSYAENIKPVTSSGQANAYLVVRLPEGTVVPPPDVDELVEGLAVKSEKSSRRLSGSKQKNAPLVLTGSLCELARTRVIYDTVNPNWDETFTSLLPPVTNLEITVFSRNLLTADELCGKATLDFNPKASRLKRKLADHLTHDVYLDLEPQGRVLLRITLEGEEEDVDFWFRRSRERLMRTRDDFVRALCAKISPYIKEVILKSFKEHDAAPLPSKSFFTPLLSGVQYSNMTQSGIPIDQPVTSAEADQLLAPLTDYLNKNLETLILSISPSMAQEVIKRIWEDTLTIVERSLVPPLFGQLEKDRRYLNKRQVTMADWAVRIMRDFFHADGEEQGLPIKTLETRRYVDLTALISAYHADLPRLRREYELSLLQGREKELILRLIRLRIEKQDEVTPADREEGRKWIEAQLVSRREKKL
ncbi:hypothetical protein HDU96_002715 [Phlyctochytrium bullatum]|nr:hypothetical protein HDU96_002715 [Phlyctochytrium bullatum]